MLSGDGRLTSLQPINPGSIGSAGASPSRIRSFSGRAFATILVFLSAPHASAQFRDSIPRPAYYAAVQELYSGEYRDAERDFRRLGRAGVQSPQARWIDSICYHAMLGETLYHQGRTAEALTEFDQACLLLLAYPDFLTQVKFDEPRSDANRARQPPPWGGSQRRFVLGKFPDSMSILMGDIGSAQRAAERGGVVALPQFWSANVIEILRTSALAMRRRNEILGPLGKQDRISKELAATLGRRLAPPNHWSQAWVELLQGIAEAGVGNDAQANTHLASALIVGGQLDHPLTGVVLLEQGRLAMTAGDYAAAAQLLAEASFSGYYYEDFDVVTESLRLGWINHQASGAGGIYGPLATAAAWAQSNRSSHVAATLRLAQAENLIRIGQLQPAAAIVEEIGRRMGPMRGGLLSIQQLYLQALINLGAGKFEAGSASLNQALAAQSAASLRNFQIERVAALYDSREVAPRIAVDLYGQLLADPSSAEWAERTFDALAVLNTSHDDAFGRWFLAALERKDVPLALDVAERAKRSRFMAALPLGGRLMALRTILEAPAGELSTSAKLERQQLLANFPDYARLANAGQQMYQQLRAGPVVSPPGANAKSLHDQFAKWSENVDARERLLLLMALSPVPSTLTFPPLQKASDLQQALEPGEALVVFHAVAGDLYGFLLSNQDVHLWQVGTERQVRAALADLLRSLGNFGPNREMAPGELGDQDWQALATKVYQGIFANSRIDLAATTELVIVPDSWLWYLPFEALVPPANPKAPQGVAELIDRIPLHYGPTAALAVGDMRPFRRMQHTGILASEVSADDDSRRAALLQPLEDAVAGSLELSLPLDQPGYLLTPLLDELVVLDDVEPDRENPYGWSPLTRGGRGRNVDTLARWMGLPFEGPERVVLTGLPTAAESGLKTARRAAGAAAVPGGEMFHTVCGLMASGARTVLLSRWRTGGQMNLQLVREFVQELPNGTAASAWQRSVLLARETPLDASQEPRLKKLDETVEPPPASHPLFWAGYLVIDTGTRPVQESESAVDAQGGAAAKANSVPPQRRAEHSPPVVPPQEALPVETPADKSTAVTAPVE